MTDFDTAWKEAIDAYFEPFMAFFFGEAHREIDWTREIKMLDKELQQITPESEGGRRMADKLVKVWRTSGQDEWVLVHIEVQSQQEKDFAERMFVYNYRIFDRYNRRVASFAILGDNRGPNGSAMNYGERRLASSSLRRSCSTTRTTKRRWNRIPTFSPRWFWRT